MIKNIYKYLFLAIFVFFIDRATKLAALMWCAQSPCTINQYISFDVVFNRGVSWGMFHTSSNTIFLLVSLVIAIVTALLCWHAYDVYKPGGRIIGHVCIIAGSCANLIDRVVYGGVVDFIILSYKSYSWPVFNIADVAIVCGVALFIFFDEKI